MPLSLSPQAARLLSSPVRTRKRVLLLSGLVLVAAVVAFLVHRQRHITENDARVMADMITISSRVDGWVAQRDVTDGDLVTAGSQLVVIDQREALMQVEELRASDEALRLESERVKTLLEISRGATESTIAAARAHRANAEAALHFSQAELDLARKDFTRSENLIAENAIARRVWDQSRTVLQQAEGKHRQALAQLAEAQANLDQALAHQDDPRVLEAQLAQLDQQRAEVQARIRQKDVALADRVVRSPVDGVVDQKFVEPGEYVIPGQRLVILHDPKAVWVEVLLKETKLSGLRPGQPVDISVDAYPGRAFIGSVERIGTAATSQFALIPSPNPSGNFTKINQRVPVRIKVEQPDDNPLRPGMMVEVDIDLAGI
ncbi:MAG: HlyD family secretion protein [Desulfovibrio sp.]|uniref:HlyD family secretion protein n=1 Tax=Desulfovibrio sp. TaxID=885 RepID=UPI0039E243F9